MRPRTQTIGLVAGGTAVAAASAVAIATLVWNRATARAVARLNASPEGIAPAADDDRYDPAELDGLPAPVARYFTYALTPGQRLVRRARLTQEGEFAARPGRWAPFAAIEHFTVSPPGFLWDARVRTAPLVVTRVRDAYIGGEGAMRAKVTGLVTVADQHGTPEMAAGSLLRYLAEAAWFPTALLPSAGVRWAAIDDDSARATLTDGATTVSMDAHFGPEGEIARVTAMRPRDVHGTPVETPFEGRFTDYARAGRMMVPRSGEVGWVLDGRWTPFWRGRTVRSDFRPRSSPRA